MRVAIIIWAVLSPLWAIFLVHLATKLPGVIAKITARIAPEPEKEEKEMGFLQGMILYSGRMKDFKGVY